MPCQIINGKFTAWLDDRLTSHLAKEIRQHANRSEFAKAQIRVLIIELASSRNKRRIRGELCGQVGIDRGAAVIGCAPFKSKQIVVVVEEEYGIRVSNDRSWIVANVLCPKGDHRIGILLRIGFR